MLIISILSILISNAVTLRRDMAIAFNRIAIISLLYCILQSFLCFSILSEVGRISSVTSSKKTTSIVESIRFNTNNIVMSSPTTWAITFSIVSWIILLFLFMNKEGLSMGTILVQLLFHS